MILLSFAAGAVGLIFSLSVLAACVMAAPSPGAAMLARWSVICALGAFWLTALAGVLL